MNKKERCKCGDLGHTFYPDENMWEPNCWDCQAQADEYYASDDCIDVVLPQDTYDGEPS